MIPKADPEYRLTVSLRSVNVTCDDRLSNTNLVAITADIIKDFAAKISERLTAVAHIVKAGGGQDEIEAFLDKCDPCNPSDNPVWADAEPDLLRQQATDADDSIRVSMKKCLQELGIDITDETGPPSLSVVNGTDTTFLRSDGVPTRTVSHIWTRIVSVVNSIHLKLLWYRLTAKLRHDPQCPECDRPMICDIVKAGTRPCDKYE